MYGSAVIVKWCNILILAGEECSAVQCFGARHAKIRIEVARSTGNMTDAEIMPTPRLELTICLKYIERLGRVVLYCEARLRSRLERPGRLSWPWKGPWPPRAFLKLAWKAHKQHDTSSLTAVEKNHFTSRRSKQTTT